MKHSPHMGFLEMKPLYLLLLTFILLTGCGFLCSSNAAPDITSLVYKGCANQTFSDQNGVYSQTLTSLFDSLISQSSKLKFFRTSSGGGGQSSFSGLFQCRGDLSNADCYSCVSKLPQMSDQLCGKTIASRIQLYGCYILYELSGFPQISGVEMLYKSCGASQAQGSGFEMRRDTALAAVESGIVSGSNGFYATKYESVYALAQCQGDLSTSDCGECVKTVVQRAQVECGSSISGQIYLQKCYMSYSYYPNGIISKTTSSVSWIQQNTGKTIAIVVGGTAGVGFGIICLLFLRSLLKKHDATLKLLSGSCYLPHPDKEETGGEDAHFICEDEQAIGVADGVGSWANVGIDSGLYARELMSNSVDAIQEEPKGSIDPVRVLEKAHSRTKAKGSSTACIIALTEQALHAINLGDSGFVVIRDRHTVFRSPVQQHDFNFPYQLKSGNDGDLPSSGQVFIIPVAPGDVIVAGTDGLFDNLYDNEITAVVVHAIRAGLGPQVMAQKIAVLAQQHAQDQNRQTPYSTAAQDAGFRNYGGKPDDITVVVSYITTSKL